MPTPPLSRRQAHYRSQLKDRLWGEGVPDDQAEAWIAEWETEARRRGLRPNLAYWRAAADWIERERGAR